MNTSSERRLWEYRWFRDAATLVAVAMVAMVAWRVRGVLLPVVLGLALAYVINPPVSWARRRLKFPRWLTTFLVMLMGAVLAAGLILYVAPKLVSQLATLAGNLPDYLQRLWESVEPWLRRSAQRPWFPAEPGEFPPVDAPATAAAPPAAPPWEEWLAGVGQMDLQSLWDMLTKWLGYGVGVVSSAISLTTYVVLALTVTGICFFYFSWKFDNIVTWFDPFIPSRHREQTLRIICRMDASVSAWFRGRLIQAVVLMVNLSVGWAIVGVRYWLLLGVISGALNLVPYLSALGWPAAIGLMWLDTLASGEAFDIWRVLVWPSVVYIVAQGIDGWIVEPLVQGRATNLDPLSVLLAVLIGASLAGVLGMILAIPVAACTRILWEELLLPRLRQDRAEPPV